MVGEGGRHYRDKPRAWLKGNRTMRAETFFVWRCLLAVGMERGKLTPGVSQCPPVLL